ncbi:sensor histidine kinase [Nocardia uniformis]|uniref:histidine kinase n=1 Tax=Nocardia uniformis TaxID=53432 RepID=A0A849C8D1_9NOCA|nr:histidine kinase [Nocardia uniformis]NNH69221.1 sensor histidine kinase [Nocardia uniformis]
MRRFSLWLRGKPLVADSILAIALMLVDALGVSESRHKAVYLAISVLLPLPVIFRRTHPVGSALVVLGMSLFTTLVHWGIDDGDALHPALLALGIMLYTLVAYVGRRQGLWYLGALILDSGFSSLMIGTPKGTDIAFTVVYYAFCWTLAEFIGARHAYDTEVAARLAVADYDRERRAHDAVSAERTRIARELHDVVAHAVSVIIVQADGARYALRRDPDTAEGALTTIASTGREALRELRRTVELLRIEHSPEQLPQHGTAGIAKLVEMMRSAGLAVELELTGELDNVSPEVSLGVHRIVQESLTNSLRYAGPDALAQVRVRRRDTDILVEVTDSGATSVAIRQATDTAAVKSGSGTMKAAAAQRDSPTRITGSGFGLVGMRERMAVLGGTLTAGRRLEGGWRVRATIPLDRTPGE